MTGTVEIYIRFSSKRYGVGVIEAPAQTIEDAAGQFCEDQDSISAFEITFDDQGRMMSGRDVTKHVIEHLEKMIDEGVYADSPHPLLEDHFRNWEEESKREAQDQEDHIRSESLPSLFL